MVIASTIFTYRENSNQQKLFRTILLKSEWLIGMKEERFKKGRTRCERMFFAYINQSNGNN